MSDRSHPVQARISREALRANAGLLARRAGRVIADLRYDAWGHGAAACAPVVTAAGLTVLVDHADLPGLSGIEEKLLTTDPAAPLASAETLWGLPGGAGRPVMSLIGSVLSVKSLREGEGVSYGYTFRAERDTTVALISGGYAQGVLRELGNRAVVGIEGQEAPIVGRVAMDACVVDLAAREVARGQDAVFFGDPERGEPSLARWTKSTGMDAAEIVSLVGARAQRRYS